MSAKMIRQKTEDLDCGDPLVSPNSKRKSESTLKQLQNDVMGKARSTLSSLGDVLKGGKDQQQQQRTVPGDPYSEDPEQSVTTAPRSPKTPKDKSSLDFFSWSKNKAKETSKSIKKDKLKPQPSQLSDVNEEEVEEDEAKYAPSSQASRTKPVSTGAIKKRFINDGNAPPVRYHGQQQQSQPQSQKLKYQTDYESSNEYNKYGNEFSRSMEDGIQYVSRDNVYNSEKYYDSRPKSYTEQYADSADYEYGLSDDQDYHGQTGDSVEHGSKCIRKISSPSSPATAKHILFNEENDILYYKDNHRPSKVKPSSDPYSKDKLKTSQAKAPPARDMRKPQDTTPMPIRKVSKDEKKQFPTGAVSPSTNPDPKATKANTKFQRPTSNVEDKSKDKPQKPGNAKPTLSRDYSMDYRYPSSGGSSNALESNHYDRTAESRNAQDSSQQYESEVVDKRSSKKICFQEPTYEDKSKCDTLPRSRKMSRKPELDRNVNEYLDTDMLRPRSGSLDSDLESQAMRIVRTVGQAFEVCHKLSTQDSGGIVDDHSVSSHCDYLEQDRGSDRVSDEEDLKKDISTPIQELPQLTRPAHLELPNLPSPNSIIQEMKTEHALEKTPLSNSREIVSLREQLEQHQLQNRQVVAQLVLVRDQLITETNARIEAQARSQQLLQQNRELLEHIASLGGYHEPDRPGMAATIGLAPQNHQQGFNDLLNLGGLGAHYPPLQQMSKPNQSPMSSLHQSGSYSAMNKLHGLNSGMQSQPNMLGTQVASLSPQEFYRLNQNILNQLTSPSFPSMYSTIPSSSINSSQHQPGSFMFANQNATGFESRKPSPGDGSNHTKTTSVTNISSSEPNLNPKDQLNSSRQASSNVPANRTGSSSDDTKQENYSTASSDDSPFIKPLSQVGTLTTLDADGKVKVIVPVSSSSSDQLGVPGLMSRKSTSFSELSGAASNESSSSSKNVSILKESKEKKSSIPSLVTLKVTDESGTVTRRLPATPSFITRTTSEKVPNRSQIMSQVQRTQWARHTTK